MQHFDKDSLKNLREFLAPVYPMFSCLCIIPMCLKKFPLAFLILSKAADTADPLQDLVAVLPVLFETSVRPPLP